MRRVYMSFMLRDGWYCQFLEEDLQTVLPRTLHFQGQGKLIELAQRAGAFRNLEDRQSVDNAIRNGRGGIWLRLTEDQYRVLCSPRKGKRDSEERRRG